MGNGELIDSMINDGLWCSYEQCHMGHAGEVVATEYHISRAQQDEYALASHRKAQAATANGHFRDEIVPVSIPQKKGAPVLVDLDESIRGDTSLDALAALKPAFAAAGSVTAGNAPPVNDGAAALVVMNARLAAERHLRPLARIVGQAASGLPPKYVLMTPVDAVRRLMQKTGWSLADVDLFEINEAFAVQLVAVTAELGIDPAKVNVNGGAVALGHAIGASGARILTTMLYAMADKKAKRGLATLCIGGGEAVALVVER
jgi:acetyl-CoA C-acetyltransferase